VPYRYRCPRCGTTSRPYATRAQAGVHGQEHRGRMHGGDHPDGERIVHVPRPRPKRAEVVAVAVFVVLLLAALIDKLT
jgi:hypothetical protein